MKKVSRFKHDIGLRAVKAIQILLMALPFLACWYGYYANGILESYPAESSWLVVFLFIILYTAFASVYDAFLVSFTQISEMIYSQSLAALMSDGIMFLVIWLLTGHFPHLLPGLAALAAQIVLASIWAYAAHKWYFAAFPPKQSAVIYDTHLGLDRLISEYGLDQKFHLQFTMPAAECLGNLQLLDGLDTVFLSGVHSHDRNLLLKYCVEHRIEVYLIPRVEDAMISGAKKMHLFRLLMLRVERYHPSPEYLLLKRLFDLAAAGAAVILLSPIMLVTAIAIKAYDGGPVLYKQTRLTKNRKEFAILKFRSMSVDAEANGIPRLSTGEQDSRITPVGRIIRKFRIDELPQLFNILGGSMTIVGPRPERPEIAAQYEEKMPDFALRLQAKAGLTGYAQVYGKYNTTPYDKLQMDLMYISHASLLEDLKICFATVKILFLPESTDGITEGATTAMDLEQSENQEMPFDSASEIVTAADADYEESAPCDSKMAGVS